MKVTFIVPYFGKLNNFFQLFLNSCRENPEYYWIIFTNDHSPYIFPNNVHVYYLSFNEMCEKIHEKISKEAKIETPYKLCDYRPCYGLIFEEFLKDSDFWGYCDVDMVFGKISNFISTEMLEKYDKLFFLGHCTLIRNCEDNNRAYFYEPEFKKVIEEADNHSFDEEFKHSINTIFQRKNKKIFLQEFEANLFVKSNYFHITRYDFDKGKYVILSQPFLFFVWDNGVLTGIWKENGHYKYEEYMYIHFQSRKMKNIVSSEEKYKIIPNSFENMESNDCSIVKKRHLNLNYFRVRGNNLIAKIKRYSKQLFR